MKMAKYQFQCEKCSDVLPLHGIHSYRGENAPYTGSQLPKDELIYICQRCCVRYRRELYDTWVGDPEWVDPKDKP